MIIHISGCVENPGEFNIDSSCTLREAIELTGGIKDKPPFIPTGIVTIKSKNSGAEIKTRKIVNFIQSPSELDNEIINDNEFLIVQSNGDELLK